jgi:hypothetical protein
MRRGEVHEFFHTAYPISEIEMSASSPQMVQLATFRYQRIVTHNRLREGLLQMSMGMHDGFASLVRGVHQRLGLTLPVGWVVEAGMAARSELALDGVGFSLLYDPLVDPRRMRMQCDLGDPAEPAPRRLEDVLTRMLELNFVLMLQQRGTTLGIDPDSGRAVCVIDGDLEAIQADALVRSLRAAAELALHWRRHGLLDDGARGGGGTHEARPADLPLQQRI